MAYNGSIIIDDAAAEADINRIRQAITILDNSLNSLKRVATTASGFQGETSIAIREKADELTRKVIYLQERLNETVALIKDVLREKHMQDVMLSKQNTPY